MLVPMTNLGLDAGVGRTTRISSKLSSMMLRRRAGVLTGVLERVLEGGWERGVPERRATRSNPTRCDVNGNARGNAPAVFRFPEKAPILQ